MKKTVLFLVLFFVIPFAGWAQLTGITPNAGVPGQPLNTTISSNGIFIQSWSPSGNIFDIRLKQGSNYFSVFDYFNNMYGGPWPEILDPSTVLANFRIPLNTLPGVYDLQVITGSPPDDPIYNHVVHSLPAAFTVNPYDGYISGTVFRDDNRNGVMDAGEPGLADKRVFLQEYNLDIITDPTGNYNFGVANGNYTVQRLFYWDYSNYFFASTPSSINVTVSNNNIQAQDFGLKTALYDVNPDTIYPGVHDTVIFYSEFPIFYPSGQSWGNIAQIRINAATPFNVPLNNVMVLDSFSVKVPIFVPIGTPPADSVSLFIRDNYFFPRYYYLYNKLVIGTPDGYITGNLFHDENKNGVKDFGEINLPGRAVKLIPSNIWVNTDSAGNYSFPAMNGNYQVVRMPDNSNFMYNSSGQDTVPVTISSGNPLPLDFGLYFALQSIQPDTGFRGITQLHTVTSQEPIFIAGGNPNGNITQARVLSNPNILINAATSITVIDSVTVEVNISIPVNTNVANNLDFRITTVSGQTHYLPSRFNVATPPAMVSGKAYFDSNQNKQYDAGEIGLSNVRMESLPDSSISFSDYNGDYAFGSLGGAFTVNYISNNMGLTLFSDSASYTFQAFGSVSGKDFGFLSSNPDYTIQTQAPYILPRCNTQQNIAFLVRNISNVPYYTRAWLKMDSQVTFVSTPVQPYIISNDTIFWDIGTLQPLTDTVITARFMLPGAGSVIGFVAGSHSLDSNNVIQNSSSFEKIWQITCAFDPNDKQVSPPGVLNDNFTLMSDSLEYLIRFQNTGNDTAFTVIVRDTLDANLDLSTFEVLGSSHSMQTEIKFNGAVAFSFNNILLPDSNVNEPASHGYILYRVRVKPGLPDATPIYNTAHIFFDLNAAVVTNTTLNTMVYVLNTGSEENAHDTKAVLYPNPMSTWATLYFNNPENHSHQLIITDITGRQVQPEQVTTDNHFSIDRKNLAGGVYFYRLNNRDGRIVSGKIIVN